MSDLNKTITDLCDPSLGLLASIEPKLRRRLFQALVSSLVEYEGRAAKLEGEHHDLVPVDTPVLCQLNEKTGNWQIRFPYGTLSSNQPAWRVLDITPAATAEIFGGILEAVLDHRLAINIPTKLERLQ